MNSQLATYKNNSYMVRKTKQVVMLYEGAIRSVQQAKAAIEEGDIETRFNALTKACEIVTGLQLSLDFDNGGEISQLLYDYYAGLDMRLMSIHQSNDAEMCDVCLRHLKMMKEAWEEIDAKQDTEEPSSVASSSPMNGDVDLSSPEVSEVLSKQASSLNINA